MFFYRVTIQHDSSCAFHRMLRYKCGLFHWLLFHPINLIMLTSTHGKFLMNHLPYCRSTIFEWLTELGFSLRTFLLYIYTPWHCENAGQSETWIFTLSTLFTDCVDYFYGIFLNLENGVKFQFILTYISLLHFTRWSETSNQAGLIESVHFRQSRTTIQVGFRGAAMGDTSGTQKWERSWWWWASVIVTVICSLL